MRLLRRRYGRKIAALYLIVLVVLPFSVTFVGSGSGSALTDLGSDMLTQTSDNGYINTPSTETQTSTDNTIVTPSSDTTTQTSDNGDTNTPSTKPETDNTLVTPSSDTTTQTSDNGDTNTLSTDSQTNTNKEILHRVLDEINSDEDSVTYPNLKASAPNERVVAFREIASKFEQVVGNVSGGELRKIYTKIQGEDTGIEEVQFTPATNLANVKISIIRLKEKPENISLQLRKNQSVYRYLDIKLTANDEYVEEDNIENLKFTFKVEKSWLAEKNIDKNTVKLIRYHDSEWQNLSTTLLSENDTYIYFEAETQGCSTFAVVGNTLVEISEPYVTETPDISWTIIIGVTTSTTVILGVVLIKARYIYFGEDDDIKTVKKR